MGTCKGVRPFREKKSYSPSAFAIGVTSARLRPRAPESSCFPTDSTAALDAVRSLLLLLQLQ
eukprot:213258-Pleurochrysis_carterae.AAC.1